MRFFRLAGSLKHIFDSEISAVKLRYLPNYYVTTFISVFHIRKRMCGQCPGGIRSYNNDSILAQLLDFLTFSECQAY